MRRVLFLALSVAATALLAQQPPPKLEPLPEAPPPPVIRDGAEEPAVRIAPQEGDKVEEIRDGGRVVMIKVRRRALLSAELCRYRQPGGARIARFRHSPADVDDHDVRVSSFGC
jgi:hypothetical protein